MANLPDTLPAWSIEQAAERVKKDLYGLLDSCQSAKSTIDSDWTELTHLYPKIGNFGDLITEVNGMGYTDDDLGPVLAGMFKTGLTWGELETTYETLRDAALPNLAGYMAANIGSFAPSYGSERRMVFVTSPGDTIKSEVEALLDAVLDNFGE